ncbi:MAG TPA: SDR family NAD(P)-dependent oxidoreductase [Acidimicrobiales bacterium]|nr:SDR family NAD(P)-dependent oxidoreductase [Acidimicrobiales bacterium]
MEDLDGKVAVITGAASGIGLAMSKAFAAKNMRLVMADIEANALGDSAEALRSSGTEVLDLTCDVSQAESVDEMAAKCFERFGTAHVVCNNAGVASGGASWEQSLEQWEWIVGVNLWGVINGVRAFVPKLIEQGEGHVVNTASMAGLVPLPMSAPYTATKHAVVGISESMFFEFKLTGTSVGISVLCPGWVNTNIGEAERNWPSRLGPSPMSAGDPASESAHQLMKSILSQGMDPTAVAALVVEAVQSDKFWILTHPEMGKAVTDRFAHATQGTNPEFVFGGLVPGFD